MILTKHIKGLLTAPFLFLCLLVFSQSGTEIYLLDLEHSSEKFIIKNSLNITNRKGYDSQPAFSPDGKSIFYTSIGDDGKAHILIYDIENATTKPFLITQESEYSPTFSQNGKSLFVVRVEKDSTQRIWQSSIKKPRYKLFDKKNDKIGYFCFSDASTFVAFKLTKPFSLVQCKKGKTENTLLNETPGRCIKSDVLRKHTYFIEPHNKVPCLMSLNNKSGKKVNVIQMPDGVQDFCISEENILYFIESNSIFSINVSSMQPEIVKVSEWNFPSKTSRLAMHPSLQKLVVVIEE